MKKLAYTFVFFLLICFLSTNNIQADKISTLRTRQVHLDFHTSEYIPAVGEKFSKKQFQEALKLGHVNSITVFGKGHHSWSYYPTKVGSMHPALTFDLLGQQIEACHEIGVRAPIYFTVGWSATDAEMHPEWCARNQDGTFITSTWDFSAKPDDPRPTTSWKNLCPSGDYHRHIMQQVEEICINYKVDGFFFDIYQIGKLCYCANCMLEMREDGTDVNNKQEVTLHNIKVFKRHMEEVRTLVKKYHPKATIFFNGTTAIRRQENFSHKMYEYNTHQELEDLPTTWGGYDKLPLQAKYFLKMGYQALAMSGKFHTFWGEFGGFKHPDAIKYEAASMAAFGAACSFGDQLHPSGDMDMETYRSIGEGYKYIEQIEEYSIKGQPVSNLGVWRTGVQINDEGVAKMLLESQHDFDIANLNDDLSAFDVIIIPGIACLSNEQAERLNGFARNGGKLLVIADGAFGRDRKEFVLDIGAQYQSPPQYSIDYLIAGPEINQGLVTSPFLNYEAAMRIKPESGIKILASIREPFFDRTYAKYSSHQNTPFQLQDAEHPGIIQKGNIIFIAHSLDKLYYEHGARLHRDLFTNALNLLHTNPMVKTEMPSAGRISFLHQPDKKRYVAHLLYGPPLQRGRCLVIEDLVPLHNIPVEVNVPEKIRKATLIPDRKNLRITKKGNSVRVTVPEFSCHCAVVFEY